MNIEMIIMIYVIILFTSSDKNKIPTHKRKFGSYNKYYQYTTKNRPVHVIIK